MNERLDVFAEGAGQSHNHSKWTTELKSSENIYENEEEIHTLEPNRTGPALSGAGDGKKGSRRAAAAFLGLLFVLLLTGLITLAFLNNKGHSEWKKEMVLSQTRSNNLSKELFQLQKRFEDMTKERNDLQRKLQDHHVQLGWVFYSGSLYYISSLKKSWQQSRDDCLQRGADLVIINSKEEQEFARRFRKLVWIGLTDNKTEGTWKWVDGTPLTTSYWAQNEPNGVQHRDEDCAEIKIYDLENSWNDESCSLQRFWMCEKKKTW
ncbi:CD209 antigen-like protein E [Chelmon rostratus]|uniref:CD209 antigen-like protein E n=1 Tax=Chelmon rostratus TaxID=109905 RepID=UPI001BE7092F|nr:CD209 antigen-like protein E [Chelmon rostratus]